MEVKLKILADNLMTIFWFALPPFLSSHNKGFLYYLTVNPKILFTILTITEEMKWRSFLGYMLDSGYS